MAKGVLVVQTAPISPERTQEYHDWYNETHLPEVLSIPGFVQARRFRLVDATGATAAGSSASLMENLAIYEVEADDLSAAFAGLIEAAAAAKLDMSDALQLNPMPPTQLFELIADRTL